MHGPIEKKKLKKACITNWHIARRSSAVIVFVTFAIRNNSCSVVGAIVTVERRALWPASFIPPTFADKNDMYVFFSQRSITIHCI